MSQGNAIGSIFYAPGNIFSSVPHFNPTLLAEALIGLPSIPSFGRKLAQDPYNLIPKACSCPRRTPRQRGCPAAACFGSLLCLRQAAACLVISLCNNSAESATHV